MISKKNLVIDIGREVVRAGVFAPGRSCPVTIHSQAVTEEGGSLAGALSRLLGPLVGPPGARKAARGFDKAAVAIPSEDLLIRIVELPFEDRGKIAEALPFELAGLLHVEVDEVVADAISLGGNKVMAVAIEKRVIREYLDILAAAGVDPAWMGPGLFALPVLVSELFGTEGTKAILCPGHFAVVRDGVPRLLKHAKRLESVGLAASFLDAEGVTVDELYFSGWENEKEGLEEIFPGARFVPLELPGAIAPEAAGALALSMLLDKGLAGTIVNFRRGEFEYTKERKAFRRRLRTTAALAAALIALLAGDLYVRYAGLVSELEDYRQSLRGSYAELFPSEKAAADPVYQLEAKLSALDKESASLGTGPGALAVMKKVAEAVPEGMGLRIDEFTLAGGRITAKGEAQSFKAADSFKESLQKSGGFREVAIGETKARPGNRTAFTITASLR